MKPYPYTYSRLPFAVAGWIQAAVLWGIGIIQLLDGSPIAFGVFAFFAIMSLGLGEMLGGRRPRRPIS